MEGHHVQGRFEITLLYKSSLYEDINLVFINWSNNNKNGKSPKGLFFFLLIF